MLTDNAVRDLQILFSDATLIDVDLSRWDGVISLYAMADRAPGMGTGRRAIVALRFRGVRRFDWHFRHHATNRRPDPDFRRHWKILRAEIAHGVISELTLSGSPHFPVLRIDFEDVATELADHAIFADVDADWGKPGSGLLKPGIERLGLLFSRVSPRGEGSPRRHGDTDAG